MNSKLATLWALTPTFLASCAQPIVCPTWTIYDPVMGQCACDADAGSVLNDTYDGCIVPDGGTVPLPGVDGGRSSDLGTGTMDQGFDLGVADAGVPHTGTQDLGASDSGPADAGRLRLQVEAYIKASNTRVEERFGFVLALSGDGDTLVVGAPFESSGATGIGGNQSDGSAPESGAVYVFRRAATGWLQQAYLKASNAQAGDRFGSSVALSGDGNVLVVGARREDAGGMGIGANEADNSVMDSGAAYVFRRTGAAWTQESYLKPSVVAQDDQFGGSVSIAADAMTFVVGAPNARAGAVPRAGVVYAFRRESGGWRQEADLVASNAGENDLFGAGLVLSSDGSRLAVGAPYEDSNSTGVNRNQMNEDARASGAVYVFRRLGGGWSQEAYIKASNTDENDEYGASVALSADGTLLVVGAGGEDSPARGVDGDQSANSAIQAGAVYAYRRSNGAWTQESYIKASNTESGDLFGHSVALSGAVLAVGAYDEASSAVGIDGDETNNAADASGAVFVFRRGAGGWEQETYVKATNTGSGDAFGYAIGLGNMGGTLAVGAPGEASGAVGVSGNQADNSAPAAGSVYTYRY